MQNGHEAPLTELEQRLQVELKIRDGAENLLQVFREGSARPNDNSEQDALRAQVEKELDEANKKISALQTLIRQRQTNAKSDPLRVWAGQHPQESQFLILEHIQLLQEVKEAQDQLLSLQAITGALDKAPAMAALIQVKDIVAALIPLLSDATHKDVRSTAHKALRSCLLDAETVLDLEASHLSWYLMRSLTRDHKFDLEKQQSLLTVRHLLQLTHTSGISLVSVGLIRAVVALAENGEDRLRFVCLETLAELGSSTNSFSMLLICHSHTRCSASFRSRWHSSPSTSPLRWSTRTFAFNSHGLPASDRPATPKGLPASRHRSRDCSSGIDRIDGYRC
jgi:rapamycin-insensitive companion of mTOR